jgi:hypothetical protein
MDMERRERGRWDNSGRCQPRDCVLIFPGTRMGHNGAGTAVWTQAPRGEEEGADSRAPPVSEEEREEGDTGCCRGCVGPEAGPRRRGKKGRGRWAALQAGRRGSPVALFYFLSLFYFPYFLLSYFEMV